MPNLMIVVVYFILQSKLNVKITLKNWFKLCKIKLILLKHPVYKKDIF